MALRDAFFSTAVLTETGIDPVLKYLATDRSQVCTCCNVLLLLSFPPTCCPLLLVPPTASSAPLHTQPRASAHAQEIDTMIVEDLRSFLFGPPGAGGMDLAALNMQRGRDHGIPPYNRLRAAYGLAPARCAHAGLPFCALPLQQCQLAFTFLHLVCSIAPAPPAVMVRWCCCC